MNIAAQRLRNQRLEGAPLAGPEEVVRWLGALQFQEYPVARWSVGQRAGGLTEDAVDRALAAGTVLRTHVLRDTWHLVTAEDIRWMMELTGPRIRARNATMHRKLDLEPGLFARTDALLADALAGGGQLTRKAVAALLQAHGIAAEGLRLGYILMHAELELLVVSGGLQGRQHTYALLDERAPHAAALPRDQALAELTRRYFTSHGPATAKDFAWWSSLTLTDVRQGLELAGDALERTVVGDRTYWSSPSQDPQPQAVSPRAHLLQGYDEYVIAYSESRDVLDVEGHAAVVPAGQAMFTHAILLDGQVVGHWRRTVTARAMVVEVQLARPLDTAETAALDDAVERYGAFVGLPARW